MKNDPIVEEIRNFRATHAAKYGNDLDKIFVAIKRSEKKHIDKLINREAKFEPHEKLQKQTLKKEYATHNSDF